MLLRFSKLHSNILIIIVPLTCLIQCTMINLPDCDTKEISDFLLTSFPSSSPSLTCNFRVSVSKLSLELLDGDKLVVVSPMTSVDMGSCPKPRHQGWELTVCWWFVPSCFWCMLPNSLQKYMIDPLICCMSM